MPEGVEGEPPTGPFSALIVGTYGLSKVACAAFEPKDERLVPKAELRRLASDGRVADCADDDAEPGYESDGRIAPS